VPERVCVLSRLSYFGAQKERRKRKEGRRNNVYRVVVILLHLRVDGQDVKTTEELMRDEDTDTSKLTLLRSGCAKILRIGIGIGIEKIVGR